jgi:thiol-disulfide isomerase/thioredoxin
MKRPTLIALGVLAVLVVTAIAVLSTQPSVMPNVGLGGGANIVPNTQTSSSTSDLPIYDVKIPEFRGITRWWNTPDNQALTPESLKGKVVLIDFWTYSCINCIRTYPFLRAMQERYADKGLVIVGVHTPEFEFEKNPDNVEREIAKNDLRYPVALDPDYGTWNAYQNRYWPAKYYFDREGRLRATHFGEGDYEDNENIIRSLLAENGANLGDMEHVQDADLSKIVTRETYFGLSRGEEFSGTTGKKGEDVILKHSAALNEGSWSAEGTWKFEDEYVEAKTDGTSFRFNVQAAKLHIVMESADGEDKDLDIFVDGKRVNHITINASDLYDIAEFADGKAHTVEIRVLNGGVRFYAATFS